MKRSASAGRRSERGFTTIEVVVVIAIVSVVMVIVLNIFDAYTLISRTQQDVAVLQQNVRVAPRNLMERIRMAGRGGLPRVLSTTVEQAIAADTTLGGETIVENTDVLTLRGTFAAPIYRVDTTNEATFVNNGDGTATLQIDSLTTSGFDQALDALHDLVEDGAAGPEAMVLVSRQSDAVYAVVELASITFEDVLLPAGDGERATLTLNITAGTGTHTAEYLALSTGGIFPPGLTSVLFASVLEEYRYFVREEFAVVGDDTTPEAPRFSRARLVPGTQTLHPSIGVVDIANDILDLQIAFGIDLDGDGIVDEEEEDGTPLAFELDEWLWNDPADDEALAWNASNLELIRFSILGRTPRPNFDYLSEPITAIENREYNELADPADADVLDRRYRRRLSESIVDLRNL